MMGSDEQESSNVKNGHQPIHEQLEAPQLHLTLEHGEKDPEHQV